MTKIIILKLNSFFMCCVKYHSKRGGVGEGGIVSRAAMAVRVFVANYQVLQLRVLVF